MAHRADDFAKEGTRHGKRLALPDKLAAMDDPHGLLLALRQYNDVNEQKIQRREHLQKPAAVSPDSWM